MKFQLAVLALFAAPSAFAQSASIPLKPALPAGSAAKPAAARPAAGAEAALEPAKPSAPPVLHLRGLDKITGRATEFTAPMNKPVTFATFTVTAHFCYSTPASEEPQTSAFVQIVDRGPEGAG